MKSTLNYIICSLFLIAWGVLPAFGQEESLPEKDKPVRSTFESAWILDNQSVMVPIKGTLEFDISHRFGTFRNGFNDLFGLYANSNIRLGFGYAPIENLYVGFGLTKYKNLIDLNLKYALLKQTRTGKIPVSITYFGNIAIDPRDEDSREEVFNSSDRYSFFHQVIIARKFTDWLSLQLSPSLSHYNIIEKTMKNDHFAVALSGQIGITGSMDIIFGVDQPITKHTLDNPNPNLSLGLQIATSSHAFQIFIGNYNSIVPQENNVFNQKNYAEGFQENFLIGFNITRLWNF